MMDFLQFKALVVQNALEQGIEQYDLYYKKQQDTSFSAYKGEIEKFTGNTSLGVCFRCIVDGKMGYYATQLFSEQEAKHMVQCAKESASAVDSEDPDFIYDGVANTVQKPIAFVQTPSQELADTLLKLEQCTLQQDNRISDLSCSISQVCVQVNIANSYGLDVQNSYAYLSAFVSPIVLQDGVKYNTYEHEIVKNIHDIDTQELANRVVQQTVASIGGRPVASGMYKIVLKNTAMATFLEAFQSIFSADSVHKELSLLKGKIGEKIASDCVTILDDPFLSIAPITTYFDDEGVPTHTKNIIENGILKTFLYDLKTAHKDGVSSTGNATRPSYSAPACISTTNCYLKSGVDSLEALFEQVGTGLYITQLSGIHSGANATTGDFSLSCKGFLIQDGSLHTPVEQITIAGNYYQMLQDIEAVGNDLRFDGNTGSPCVVIKSLSVAGI